jgi:hypothetical protein
MPVQTGFQVNRVHGQVISCRVIDPAGAIRDEDFHLRGPYQVQANDRIL